ncbi:unnamed protein product [Ranitomeya imitator]|uniref:Helix-turn-helix domain-containing protein n=1 Tax=Ranitomeya imitator TaxID=111125 RepID=A0ABN9LZ86_9NEOB|nr:unnamed protein product [Ranitomeya imitator]
MVTKEIESLPPVPNWVSNLKLDERQALRELQSWDDIVIKQADKGGNTVLWPNTMYEKQANKILGNSNCYKKLCYNPLTKFQQDLVYILESAYEDGIIPRRLVEVIKKLQPRLATFYLLPKLHKNQLDPPGRPIVPGNGGLCEIICTVIDHYLQPLVQTLPSYIKDTTMMLKRLDSLHLEKGAVLVTADVEALYSSIRHSDGLTAVSHYLRESNLESPLIELILTLLKFILEHNVFIFGKDIYVQKQGTAMGATCAPAYANLFMGYWERCIFQNDDLDNEAIQGWSRFIDDILFIWEDSPDKLHDLITRLNQNQFNIKLTYNFGRAVEFLDLKIMALEDGQIITDVFRKPTATNTLLHALSAHHRSTINGIPAGQFLRIKRICTNAKDYEKQASDLAGRFIERGYSKRQIKKGCKKASETSREELLYGSKRDYNRKTDKNEIRFIKKFNKQWPELTNIMYKHWGILQSDPILKQFLSDRPSMVPRRSRNLKDLLVHSHYSTTRQVTANPGGNGFFPCNMCKGCRNLFKSKTFVNFDGSRIFEIRKRLTCSSKGVIYHAQCPCKKVYIGMTT